jgi:hypothetical protein
MNYYLINHDNVFKANKSFNQMNGNQSKTDLGQIQVVGEAELVEVYKTPRKTDKGRPKGVGYFARLKISLSGNPRGNMPKEAELDVPIVQNQYSYLRQCLELSQAECPILRVKGDLSLVVDACHFE